LAFDFFLLTYVSTFEKTPVMKRSLGLAALMLLSYCSFAQITITAADMPVAGDNLTYSNVDPATVTISPGDSGANINWNYELIGTTQGADVYKTPAQINPILGFTLSGDLYGIKTLDSIPFIGLLIPGISISDIYTFYGHITIPSCYVALATSMTVSGFPIGSYYTEPDVLYKFPLTYGSVDSNFYEVNQGLASAGSIKRVGYRKNTVDSWGTITTPYYETPVDCIRVRSEIFEVDSISISGITFGLPNNTVEYKWLVNGDHYPALWVTNGIQGNTIRYRDRITEPSSVKNTTNNSNVAVTACPNPAPDGVFTLRIPSEWKTFHAGVYDMQSRLVVSQNNNPVINMKQMPAGNYVVRVLSGDKMAFVPVVK